MPVHISPDDCAVAVLQFWFDEVGEERWYAKSDALDAEIADRFGAQRDSVLASEAAGWRDTPDHVLAAIILLDQFSRNMHRGRAEAFAADPLALELTRLSLARGWDRAMPPERRQFLLMPLMHSEAHTDQDRALVEFAALGGEPARFARLHHDQIARFGRFPGRNAALGRSTTPEEARALDAGAAF